MLIRVASQRGSMLNVLCDNTHLAAHCYITDKKKKKKHFSWYVKKLECFSQYGLVYVRVRAHETTVCTLKALKYVVIYCFYFLFLNQTTVTCSTTVLYNHGCEITTLFPKPQTEISKIPE